MRSNDARRQPQSSEDATDNSAESATTPNEHFDGAMSVTAQNGPQEMDACGQKGGCGAFDDDEFVTMSDTLPEMDVIFENEYTM